ncbi:LutB/LldF family L-lactate oxidation iron-sulfur protein [Meiothermus taiwanensis]|jgi:L-lactate dehydrogenase complex protein LldF|uniref:Lactate utilization protein B n=2 Tax=Meiothermus taiwanensis TaxID=172827 RepID=A0A399DRS6_9DEIN|nr:LutB/LldF family L-lactate oxidation iron-sulfur protein [Meiothermus taiwanensis]AWR87446.1 iron-sulfur cluster binding protein [Meiothermus taiwanensis WR-220]KIQ55916.1 (Fe-S)-binding protein [Meiothermus taiwanensis]KZK17113.1 (Fe-S)-binding protein [Meiothermus taiwanensis]RIH74945.1 Lactate utilization protein B [Meiothermus taiwanensis]
MKPAANRYPQEAARVLREEPQVRESVTGATLNFDSKRRQAYAEVDAEAWRHWAEGVKNHLLMHLDQYLAQAETSLQRNGVQVHWAEDADDARRIVAGIARKGGVRKVVKAKSMISEELGLNPMLEGMGLEVLETDLGEYIIQLLNQPPSHIVGPAIHLNLAQIRQLFHQRFQTPPEASPEELAAVARKVLREGFLTADMGLSGANFVVAETGTLALIENEGNIRLSTSAPRIHVALVGLEKLLPRFSDLAIFLQLTARAATGQRLGTFVSLIQGPRRPGEPDGPEEVHVVFVDNGRSSLLADLEAWETLRCVRCAACLNACPVYRQTGGHAYGYVYSGPIGAILSPGLLGLEETKPLPYASSLCGACFQACPVRIPIPKLLLTWRHRAVAEGLMPRLEAAAIKGYALAMTQPWLYRLASKALRLLPEKALDNRVVPVVRAWVEGRAGLKPSPKSFQQMWEAGEV